MPRHNRLIPRSVWTSVVEPLETRRLLSSIAGAVYNDLNGDGVRQAAEPGLNGQVAPNWTVFLDTNNNGMKDAGESSVNAGATGQYSFPNLAAGTYVVGAVAQSGYKLTSHPTGGTLPLAATHDYPLKGNFLDTHAGPALKTGGGTIGANGYTFAVKQGLTLSGAVTAAGSYSIQIVVKLTAVDGYRKILDFKNRVDDAGLYDLNGALTFYGSGGSSAVSIKANQTADIVLTRDATTKLVTGYVDGVKQFSFTDTNGLATFSGPSAIINILQDDLHTDHEYAAGTLTHVTVFNSAITAAQVTTLHKGGTPSHANEWLVNLGTGQNVTAKDFGFQKLGATHLKGVVFTDTNGDGTQGAGETAIANAVVYIDTNKNGKLDAGEVSTKTAADGTYDIAGLAPGSYNVAVVAAAGNKVTTPTQAGTYLTNQYSLKNSLKDDLGGAALVSGGGTLSASGYAFSAGKDIQLAAPFNFSNYSIELHLKLADVSGYRKLIDFKNLTADAGLYDHDGHLSFYGTVEGSKIVITNNTAFDVVITRNSSTKVVTGYVNGVQQFTFVDNNAVAVFTAQPWLLRDDNATNHEFGAGILTEVRVYNGALTAAQVLAVHGGGTPPLAIHEYNVTVAVGQTVTGLKFGEKKIV